MAYYFFAVYHIMLSWENLKKFDMTIADHRFLRAPEVYERYKKDLSIFANTGMDINDHILSLMGNYDIVLMKNKYPYLAEGNICHMVLWMRPRGAPLSMHGAKILVVEKLAQTMPVCMDQVIIFENIAKNKSVKSVPHYQIFVRMN